MERYLFLILLFACFVPWTARLRYAVLSGLGAIRVRGVCIVVCAITVCLGAYNDGGQGFREGRGRAL